MIEMDHSIVFRRSDGSSGSGTVIYANPAYLIVEVYQRGVVILGNECLSQVRLTSGRSMLYGGTAVVRKVIDMASMQVLVLYLRDPWIACGCMESEADNRFEVERYLGFQLTPSSLPCEVNRALSDFHSAFVVMMSGLRISQVSHLQHRLETGKFRSESFDRTAIAINRMVDELHLKWLHLAEQLRDRDDEMLMQVGNYFKNHILPLCKTSRVFKAFHTPKRLPYFGYSLLAQIQSSPPRVRTSMQGMLLDRFLSKFADIDFLDQRATMLTDRSIQKKVTENKDLRILILGTDALPLKWMEGLKPRHPQALKLDLVSFFPEDIQGLQSQLENLARNLEIDLQLRFWTLPIEQCLEDYFCNIGTKLSSYDCILSNSILQGCSDKNLNYLLDYFANRLRPGGIMEVFCGQPSHNLLRELWLLYYDSVNNPSDIPMLPSSKLLVTAFTEPFGTLLALERPS
jgi:hypothetical protein